MPQEQKSIMFEENVHNQLKKFQLQEEIKLQQEILMVFSEIKKIIYHFNATKGPN